MDRDQMTVESTTTEGRADGPVTVDDNDLIEDELLVEEISIDGMCGVY